MTTIAKTKNVIVPTHLLEMLMSRGNKQTKLEVGNLLKTGEVDFSGVSLQADNDRPKLRLHLKLPEGYNKKQHSPCPDCYREALASGETAEQALLSSIKLNSEKSSIRNKPGTYCKNHANMRVQQNKKSGAVPKAELVQRRAERKLEKLQAQIQQLQQTLGTKLETKPSVEPPKARLIKSKENQKQELIAH